MKSASTRNLKTPSSGHLKPRSPKQSFVETNHLVLPSHTNALGTLFGGILMSWIDIAAAISAQRHSGAICVTAGVDALHFLAPIFVGDAVTLKAKVVYTGKTSMIVEVMVTRSKAGSPEPTHCVTSTLSLVALNRSRKPTPVAPLLLTTHEEKRSYRLAAERRNFLLGRLRDEMKLMQMQTKRRGSSQ